jgi:hypothetical protein
VRALSGGACPAAFDTKSAGLGVSGAGVSAAADRPVPCGRGAFPPPQRPGGL